MAITNSAAKSPSATFPSHAFVTSSSPETTSEFAVQRVQSDLQCAAHPDMRCHPPRQRRPHRIVRAHHHPTRTPWQQVGDGARVLCGGADAGAVRSEEHTSELQSRENLV